MSYRKTKFDPFRYSNDRKLERSLIVKFEQDMNEFLVVLNDINKSLIKELLTLPQNVKGFGHIKEANIKRCIMNNQFTSLNKIQKFFGYILK